MSQYPTINEFVRRENQSMDWKEYAEYLRMTTDMTSQQSYIAAGQSYRMDNSEIANYLETTPDTVSTQSSRVNYRDMDWKKRKELIEPFAPATPFRYVGNVEYFYSDYWPERDDAKSGEVYVFMAVRESDTHVAVVEQYSRTIDDERDDDILFGVPMENIEKETIYNSFDNFLNHSKHSPLKVPTADEYHIVKEGLFVIDDEGIESS